MRQGLRITLSLVQLLAAGLPTQTVRGQTPQGAAPPPAAAPDSPSALQDFLEDLISAIKSDDKPKIDSLWRSTVLPDHAAWFASEFGDREGAALDAAYAKQLTSTATGPDKTCTYVAGLDSVKLVVLPLAQAAVSRPDSWAKIIQLAMKVPVPVFRAEAIGPGSATSYMLGYFFYAGGGFRLIDENVFDAFSVGKGPPRMAYISSAEAQMLLLQSSPPVTPPLLRKDGISNTVMLEVIIDVLGQVQSALILSGDLTLGNAARAAVLSWRYRPYIQNGRAVPFETTVTVTFPF
jgi:TonB family protein